MKTTIEINHDDDKKMVASHLRNLANIYSPADFIQAEISHTEIKTPLLEQVNDVIADLVNDDAKLTSCGLCGEIEPNHLAECPNFIVQTDSLEGDVSSAEKAFGGETTTQAPPPPDTGVVLDKNGLPWDARIHGKAKKQDAKGAWKFTKGIDRITLVPQVEAELRQALAAGTIAPAASTQAPPPPPATTNTTAPVTGDVSKPPTTFIELLTRVTAAKNAGDINDHDLADVAAELGVADFGNIAVNVALIPKAAELLGV